MAGRLHVMPRFYNRSEHKLLRQYLRRHLSKAEIILWSQLQGRQLGYKFRRQHGVGPYVVDFYCAQMRLAIEVDGDQHCEDERAKLDYHRQRFIERQGIRVVRFSTEEVLTNLLCVLDRLRVILTFPRP